MKWYNLCFNNIRIENLLLSDFHWYKYKISFKVISNHIIVLSTDYSYILMKKLLAHEGKAIIQFDDYWRTPNRWNTFSWSLIRLPWFIVCYLFSVFTWLYLWVSVRPNLIHKTIYRFTKHTNVRKFYGFVVMTAWIETYQ